MYKNKNYICDVGFTSLHVSDLLSACHNFCKFASLRVEFIFAYFALHLALQ